MNRRRFLGAATVAAGAAAPLAAWRLTADGDVEHAPGPLPRRPLALPPDGLVRVAFAIGPGVNG